MARLGGDGFGGGSARGETSAGGSVAGLREVVEGWRLAVDGDEVAEVLGLLDRLTAKVHASMAAVDEAELWEHDGATSMTAWLRSRGGLTRSEASRAVGTCRRLRRWPATAAAWEDGVLSGAQVQVISANVGPDHVERYAEREAELVAVLAPLSSADTGRVMSRWRARADAAADGPGPGREPRRHLHLSPMLDGRHRLDGELDAEGAAVVAEALAWAATPDVDGDPPRSPSERRGDALVEVCRRALAIQTLPPGCRRRPHINVRVDFAELTGGERPALGRLDDGTTLDAATTHRLLCDADIHRFVTAGRSTILDYGTATRTVSPALFQALVVRDGGCRWPGCDRPHAWCEAHHVRHWPAGGPTNPGNLVLLCSRHHHLAHGQHGHRTGWQVALTPDATLIVTSPEGRTTRSRPPP